MLRHWTFYLGLAAAGGFSALRGVTPPPPRANGAVPVGEAGSRLPGFTATDLGGHAISAADLRGKVVLVDFWATWCAPCKKEMSGYQQLAERYRRSGLVVIGFKSNDMADTEDPAAFAKKIGVRYPLIVATDELLRMFGGIEGLPTTILYDRQGILRKKIIGFEYTETVEEYLKPLL
jgi:cytochrome c biogenesis protein CcmG/thiol:disulfide interchange protein DsbE